MTACSCCQPLGSGYAATGAAAGLCGAIVTGIVAAIISTSSFIITSPRVSESLLLAGLIIALSADPIIANDKHLIVVAVFSCVMLGGIWQSLLGLAGVAKVIKFTPHPVLVGFLNGVAVLVALSQLKPYFLTNATASNLTLFDRPWQFLLLLGVAALMLLFPVVAKRVPSSLSLAKVPAIPVGFIGGIVAFYFFKGVRPDVDLGSTIGNVSFVFPLFSLSSGEAWQNIARLVWEIVPISIILAIVATMDSLLAFRAAQNVSELQVSPIRDLFAHGVANCASALAGGVTAAASPSSTMAAYRAGGRTWLTPISSASFLLALVLIFPNYLALIPSVVLSGILLAVGISLFDRWTLQIVLDVRQATSPFDRRRAVYDLAVVLLVMGITVFYSMVAGVIAGCLLAGIVFIMNMSRPIVRRTLLGSDIQSKRLRPAKDVEILLETGSQRIVLQLEGVLFFGNADDLSVRIKSLFQNADMVALDLRVVNDIDVSGANILANLMNKSRELKKTLLFCGVPSSHLGTIKSLVQKAGEKEHLVQADLDSALEWMEEKTLLQNAAKRSQADVLPLSEIDFLVGVEEQSLDRLREVLIRREFAPGEVICREGDEGDRMWLLAKGSVSVRLTLSGGRESLRIASLARGTTIGEMSLINSARRSASIIADEPVVCYELLQDGFSKMLAQYPTIAAKLLSNLARELSRRLRRTSEDLRNRS